MVEVPASGPTANQSIGRVWRMGQTHQINAFILTTDYTYDQVIQSRAAKKYYMQLAATADLDFKTPAGNSVFDQDNSEDENEQLSASRAMVIGYYTKMFGQRSPRDQWDDVHDLTSKDKLPGEGLGLTLEKMLENRKSKKSRGHRGVKGKGKVANSPPAPGLQFNIRKFNQADPSMWFDRSC